jgi:hypothetical protein
LFQMQLTAYTWCSPSWPGHSSETLRRRRAYF